MKLIDKNSLVEELERRRNAALMRQQNLEAIGQETVSNEMIAFELDRIISFINTLEVKEDDNMIEKTCKYLKTHLWQSVDDDNDPIVESVHNITLDNFIKDFKRYLENEL